MRSTASAAAIALAAIAAPRACASAVVISGAGPAGLLATHAILERRPDVRVTLFDRRGDPRTVAADGFRAYSLGINARGRAALQRWDGLWEAVCGRGVLSSKFLLHAGPVTLQLRSNEEGTVPTLLISRHDLCATLLEELDRRHGGPGGRLTLKLGDAVERVDFDGREVVTKAGVAHSYDDLIAADGVRSLVREALAFRSQPQSRSRSKHQSSDAGDNVGVGPACDGVSASGNSDAGAPSGEFRREVVDLPGRFMVFIQACPPAMEPEAVHAMGAKGYTLFSIPRRGGEMCTLLSWPGGTGSDDAKPDFLSWPDSAIRDKIASDLPKFGPPSLSALSQLRQQRPSKAATVRCSRYHDSGGRVLLLGDAAHSTGGALGQGLNSALADVVALDELLAATELRREGSAASRGYGSIVDVVGEEFTKRQQPEGLALWKLLQLPPRGHLRVPYLAVQAGRAALAGAMRQLPSPLRVARPVQTLLSESTIPFTEIVERNRVWVEAALHDAPGAPADVFEL